MMKNSRKINLKDVSDKQSLSIAQLSKIIGGADLDDGCISGVCENNREYGTKYCEGGAVCTQGVSTCTQSTDPPTCATRR